MVGLLILLHDDEFIDKQNDKGETPLHIAAKYGYILVVLIFLLLNKQDTKLLTTIDNESNTPLHVTVSHGHEIIAQILIGHFDMLC